MGYRLSCEQVSALINFYVEGALSDILTKYVKEHLQSCPICREKYNKIQEVLKVNVVENTNDNKHNSKQYETFKMKLGEYVDNELEDCENIKIKKIAISNPLARQDLEDMYSFKRLIQSSYERTKNELKNDYSKDIICKIKNDCPTGIDTFYKISAMFFAIISLIISGIIVFLYF